MPKLRFALFGNIYQAKKSVSIQKLICLLQEREAEISVDSRFFHYLTDSLRLSVSPASLIENDDFRADYVISMGGDGTFLEAASRVRDKGIPILGINMGHLGFLADVPADEIPQAIQYIYSGKLAVEPRSVLQLAYDQGSPSVYPFALNEVAVLKQDNSSMISIRVDINGEYLATYQADGLIINTPTGSTGYALSVGGPIMSPEGGMLGLTAVAPHSLNVRPITLPDSVEVGLRVLSRNHHFLVSVDGRSETCPEGTRLTLRRAPYDILVAKRPGTSFFRTLRGKLMLGSDLRFDNMPERPL
ncbi:MAG: NAD kinase [Prevotellaceae bacterium]|nr:NAD kinase [Prevotellaceae bacterium]